MKWRDIVSVCLFLLLYSLKQHGAEQPSGTGGLAGQRGPAFSLYLSNLYTKIYRDDFNPFLALLQAMTFTSRCSALSIYSNQLVVGL